MWVPILHPHPCAMGQSLDGGDGSSASSGGRRSILGTRCQGPSPQGPQGSSEGPTGHPKVQPAFLIFEAASLWSLGWPRTPSVTSDDFEPLILPPQFWDVRCVQALLVAVLGMTHHPQASHSLRCDGAR